MVVRAMGKIPIKGKGTMAVHRLELHSKSLPTIEQRKTRGKGGMTRQLSVQMRLRSTSSGPSSNARGSQGTGRLSHMVSTVTEDDEHDSDKDPEDNDNTTFTVANPLRLPRSKGKGGQSASKLRRVKASSGSPASLRQQPRGISLRSFASTPSKRGEQVRRSLAEDTSAGASEGASAGASAIVHIKGLDIKGATTPGGHSSLKDQWSEIRTASTEAAATGGSPGESGGKGGKTGSGTLLKKRGSKGSSTAIGVGNRGSVSVAAADYGDRMRGQEAITHYKATIGSLIEANARGLTSAQSSGPINPMTLAPTSHPSDVIDTDTRAAGCVPRLSLREWTCKWITSGVMGHSKADMMLLAADRPKYRQKGWVKNMRIFFQTIVIHVSLLGILTIGDYSYFMSGRAWKDQV
jgi:hypothetical protein